ncbi:MAG TPA: DUF3866 family protein [Gaiellaceae bacterium]|nr:DUF3866 family protein [Gaiellaceae bacterium]
MPLTLRRGTVTAVVERHPGLVRLEVDGLPCVAYPELTGPVEPGDDVVVNVQARELALGSGGFDVLHANLTRGLGLPPADGAHVMKLPYTPLQHAVRHVEEDGPLAETLDGMPVVCCSLHSQVLPALAALGEVRVVYVQVAGGALPVDLSDAVRAAGVTRVAVGACFGGDAAAVTVASALAWAAARGFDAAVCSIGPGIVGTGSALGHGGLAAAAAATAAAALEGEAILAARVSDSDLRERHRGVSHHTIAAARLCRGAATIAWPAGRAEPEELRGVLEVVDASGWREACRALPLSHMGRGADDDPAFFEAAYAAGVVARRRRG